MTQLVRMLFVICAFTNLCFCQKLSVEKFIADDVPKYLYKGKIIDGVKWSDKEGAHIVSISRFEKGMFFNPGWYAELNALKITSVGDAWKVDWKIKDFTPKIYIDIKYFDSSIRVFDIDNDGIGETSFFYALIPDGAESRTLKFMLHYKNEKLPIRGIIPASSDTSDYEKQIDLAYNKYPQLITKYASEYWDAFVHKTFSCFQ